MDKQYSAVDKLRNDHSEATKHRRQIASLAALGLLDFSVISLFQLGYIKKMPDLPGKLFDSEKVNSSKEAVLLGIPDGVISLGMYAATMFLATLASNKKKKAKWLDYLLGGIIAGQALGAAHYLYVMSAVHKKVCLYCVGGAAINFAAVKPMVALLKSK
jgi:uncharacterized membrane protein